MKKVLRKLFGWYSLRCELCGKRYTVGCPKCSNFDADRQTFSP